MFEEQTYSSVLTRMKNGVESGIDTREGSVMHNALAPAAAELSYLYDLLKIILRETYADTASREYLILRAAERGLSPNPATRAEIKAEITGNFEENQIIDSEFSCDSVFYTVKEAIEGEENTYRLVANEAGTSGNIISGYLTNESYVQGIEIAKIISILVFAEDEEETEDFRARYIESIHSIPFAGNISAYKEMLNSFEEVGGTKVIPAWTSGNKSGEVEVIILSSALKEPTPQVVEDLQNRICPGTFTYSIAGPSEWTVGDTFTIGNQTYNCVSKETKNNDFTRTFGDNAFSEMILENIHNYSNNTYSNGTLTFECNINYRVEKSEGASGSVEKECDLTGGMGTGLAPIGHSVQISPVSAKLVIVNFDITASDYGIDTSKKITNLTIIEAISKVITDFGKNWENYTSDTKIYQSWFVSALQQIPEVDGVNALQISFVNGSPDKESLRIKTNEIIRFEPTLEELRKLIGDRVYTYTENGATYTKNLYKFAKDKGATLQIKVYIDYSGKYTYRIVPFLYFGRITSSCSINNKIFNYEQKAFKQLRDYEIKVEGTDYYFERYIDRVLFKRLDDPFDGTGVLSIGMYGNCMGLEMSNVNSIPFKIYDSGTTYPATNGETTISTLEDGNFSEVQDVYIELDLITVKKGSEYNTSGHSDSYERERIVHECFAKALRRYEENLYNEWIEDTDISKKYTIDLNEIAMLEEQIEWEDYNSNNGATFKLCFSASKLNLTDEQIESQKITDPWLTPPAFSYTIRHLTTEIESTIQYKNGVLL